MSLQDRSRKTLQNVSEIEGTLKHGQPSKIETLTGEKICTVVSGLTVVVLTEIRCWIGRYSSLHDFKTSAQSS